MVTSRISTNLLRLGSMAACIAMFASIAHATTYYVSNSGADGNNGTSQGTAWQTVAKVNGFAFAAGDQVLFQRGGIWRESLVPTVNGATGNPITFADYGSGNKPTFYGSDVLLNASFGGGGGSYTYNVGGGIDGNYAYVLQNHVFLGTGPATYNDPNITVTIGTDPRTDGKLYTFCKRANVVLATGRSHLVFRNLIADETVANDGASQGYGMRAEGSTDILFENCEALRCGRHNMASINSDQVTFRGCHVAYVAPNINAGNSLYVSYADANLSAASSASVYENCTADNQSGYDFYDGHSQNGKPLHVIFIGCNSSDSKFYCDSNVGGTYAFTNCTLQAGRIEIWAPNAIVDGCTFMGNAFIDDWANNCTFQNNLFAGVNPGESGCFIIRPGVQGAIIRFCTVVASGGDCLAFYGSAPSTQIYGNIFQGGTITYGGSAADVTADYNFYPSSPTIFGNSWAAWQGLGKDTHGNTGNPLFVGGGNYSLQAGSPCMNAGGGTVIPATDILGSARPQGAGPEMGAYEYNSAPVPPVINSPLTASGTVGQFFTYTITASGNPTNYGCVGTLPSGLSFSGSTISGTPTAIGTNTVTISATGAGGVGSTNLTITIGAPGTPVITSATAASGYIGQLFSYMITATQSPTNYDCIGTLPAGLSCSGNTISGTPTTVGTNTVTIRAFGLGGTGTASLTITITQLAAGNFYYVSTTGSDSNDGRTPSTAWKTVAKVNGTAFVAGDTILFARGGVWRESLAPTVSGSAPQPITFDAYGTGAKPTFMGSIILTNANFSLSGTNYTYSLPGLTWSQVYVLQNNQFLNNSAATYANPTLTIASSTDPRSDGKVYTACVRGKVIGNNYQSNLIFRNLIADETAAQFDDGGNWGYAFRMESASNIVIEDCEAYHVGRAGCASINCTALTGRRVKVGYPAPGVTGGSDMFLSFANTASQMCSNQWIDCISDHPENGTGGANIALSSFGDKMGSVVVQGLSANSEVDIWSQPSVVKGGTISSNAIIDVRGNGTIVDGVTFKENAALRLGSNSNIVQNCLFDLAPTYGGAMGTASAMWMGNTDPTITNVDCIVRFNTFSCVNWNAIGIRDNGARLQVYGNMMMPSPGIVVYSIWGGTGMDLAYCDYNFYQANPGFMVQWVTKDLATWQGYGFDLHCLTGNPLFIGSGDYHLQTNSPAIDKVTVASNMIPSLDFDGTTRPQGTKPDMGAFEYGAAPTGSTVIAQFGKAPGGGNSVYLSWTAAVGRSYGVQTTTNLVVTPWAFVSDSAYTNIVGSGSVVAYTNAVVDPERFYRLHVK